MKLDKTHKTMKKSIYSLLLALVFLLIFGCDSSKRAISSENSKNLTPSNLPRTIKSKKSGITFVLVQPGSFVMGAQQGESARPDETQHNVKISKPFYIAAHEVTVGQFENFVKSISEQSGREWMSDAEKGTSQLKEGKPGGFAMNAVGKNEWQDNVNWRNPGFQQSKDHPVVYMSWNDAKAYANWLKKSETLNYRLPTEAEWEYACRANTKTAYWWGDKHDRSGKVANVRDQSYLEFNKNLEDIMNANDGFIHTSPVGSYQPNAFELYDMIGNVWEWVEDYYGPYKTGGTQVDPTGPKEGTARVARGGGFRNAPDRLRSAARFQDGAECRFAGMGFRLVLEVDEQLLAKYKL